MLAVFAAISSFRLINSNSLYVLYAAITISLIIDTHSSFVSQLKYSHYLAVLDIITIWNYMGFVVLMLKDDIKINVNNILMHYLLLFLIYVFWNTKMAMTQGIEKKSRNFFIGFSIIEIPIIIWLIYILLSSCENNNYDIAIFVIPAIHLTILLSWSIVSYWQMHESRT